LASDSCRCALAASSFAASSSASTRCTSSRLPLDDRSSLCEL
jgi:hypothetical protein